MDFWDLTKLLARRWQIALPMLALAVLTTVLTYTQVKPDYVGTAYITLVPPVPPSNSKPGDKTPYDRNPWLNLGLEAIGNAAMVTVRDQKVMEQLKKDGFSESYTVALDDSSGTMVTFEVIGKDKNQAEATAEQLVLRFTNSVRALQERDGITAADQISARRLDQGANVTKSDSKVKRALVAVAGVGILLTAAVTIGADAWLRKRPRRRPGADRAVVASAGPAPPADRSGPNDDGDRVEKVREGVTVEFQPPGGLRKRSDDLPEDLPSEATVVLPISALPAKAGRTDRS